MLIYTATKKGATPFLLNFFLKIGRNQPDLRGSKLKSCVARAGQTNPLIIISTLLLIPIQHRGHNNYFNKNFINHNAVFLRVP